MTVRNDLGLGYGTEEMMAMALGSGACARDIPGIKNTK